MTAIDGLPDFLSCDWTLGVCVRGSALFVRCACFLARVSLPSGTVDWVVERSPPKVIESTSRLPRRIQVNGTELWAGGANPVVAEIASTECGGLNVSARCATTGRHLWERFVPIPEAADWAEPSPAWPWAQTEEIYAFIVEDRGRLVVCLSRHTRRSMLISPSEGIEVSSLPPFACQTDAIRFHPLTGEAIWRASYRDVPVRILERLEFTGVWANSPRVGIIDFETGANAIWHELPRSLGWPVRDGPGLAVPWHARKDVGVVYVDERGTRTRQGTWPQPRVTHTGLHRNDAGLALRTNDQTLWWLGDEWSPLWSVRAKPYIYKVHRSSGTDLFIGTDGNGGRLLALDAITGKETLDLKPARGGAGPLAKVPGHDALVTTFGVSRSNSLRSRLLVVSMKDRRHRLADECFLLLGMWEHGVVCRTGRQGERLAIADIRPA